VVSDKITRVIPSPVATASNGATMTMVRCPDGSSDKSLRPGGFVAEVAARLNGSLGYQLDDAADGHQPVMVRAVDNPRAAADGAADGARRVYASSASRHANVLVTAHSGEP
jgi:hypothetical protein